MAGGHLLQKRGDVGPSLLPTPLLPLPPRGLWGRERLLTDHKTCLLQPAPSEWDKGQSTSPSPLPQRPTCHQAALNQLGWVPSPGVNQLRPASDGRAERGSKILPSREDGETEG